MKFRYTIGARLYLGFGIIIISTILAFILTNQTLDSSRKLNDKINNEVSPSVTLLEDLYTLILRSKMDINAWVNAAGPNDNPAINSLDKLMISEYPQRKKALDDVSIFWSENERIQLMGVYNMIDTLFTYNRHIMQSLNTLESYEDASVKFDIDLMIEESGEVGIQTNRIFNQLTELIKIHKNHSIEYSDKMLNSFDLLQYVVRMLGIALVVGGILIAFFTIRSIVKPISFLKRLLILMGKGITPKEQIRERRDEIGEMSMALKNLISGFERTTQFANDVGSGNFESDYRPLSDQDSLGAALLKMRTDLAENERVLEQKVIERTEEVVKQRDQIENQRSQLEFLYDQVTDSIKYAKRIQEAILPSHHFVNQLLPQSFILFKPKDIVSGDFYWVEKKNNKVFYAAVDCTGHGVPGAFMSIVGHNILKHSLSRLKDPNPSQILDELSKGVFEALHQNNPNSTTKDGMDITVCSLDTENNLLEFAGAFNPLYLVRNNEVTEIKGDKLPIGIFVSTEEKKFTNHTVQLQKNDVVYVFSDGYCDQFGGPKGKKFMASRFRELLLSIQHKPMIEQRNELFLALENWRGDEDQVDDVLVIGVKV